MAISNLPLGLNARNFLFIRRNNFKSAKRLADNKIATKKLFTQRNIPTPELITVFENRAAVRDFNWQLPKDGFVIKPSRGYGGEGILVFKSWNGEFAETLSGNKYDKRAIESHLFDILEGVYSLQSVSDTAYIEELVTPAPFFRKLTAVGLPDIRVIVYKRIPIMAMMRLPNSASHGKANLHLGALGIAIGLRSGITFNGLANNKPIKYFPGTKIKVRGVKIPYWQEILLLAAKVQDSSGLGYAGVDIVIDKNRGPLVLEVNTRPGLSIQLVNQTSLRTRLETLEKTSAPTIERGVEIAQTIFSDKTLEQIDTSPTVLSVIEPVTFNVNDQVLEVSAKLDTGAYRTSLDHQLVEQLGLKPLSKQILIKSASGNSLRPAVHVTFNLNGRTVKTIATIVDREHLKYPLIIGRRDMKGFLVNPALPLMEPDPIEETETEE